MEKLIFTLFLLIFTSSASATIYKWVDQGGAVNFADDYNKVPPDYRNKAEEVSVVQPDRRYDGREQKTRRHC